MSLLSKIFDFIKGLFTRAGLHTFLQKYQAIVIQKLAELAEVHSGVGLNDWWDTAFAEIRTLVKADVNHIHDNWIAIVINLAWEVIKAEREKSAHSTKTEG